jgi:hypothetical protein
MFPKDNRDFAFGIPCEAMSNASCVVKNSAKEIIFRCGNVFAIYQKMNKGFPGNERQKNESRANQLRPTMKSWSDAGVGQDKCHADAASRDFALRNAKFARKIPEANQR